jgi:hypothetical protein
VEMCWRSMASLIGYDASGIQQLAMLRHKKPPPSHTTAGGGIVSTRAAWHYIHTARLGAGRRIHRSAPHGKDYCHTDRPTRSRRSSNPLVENIVPCPRLLSRDQPAWRERLNTTPPAWRRGVKATIPEVMDVVHGLSGCSAAL